MRVCLIIAAIFWFNPLVSNVDVLPDLVSYLLVLKAFSKLSYIHEYANELCIATKKMCIVSGAKILSIYLVSSLDPSMSMLLSFSFCVVEMIFGIPFFVKLFNAFSHLIPAENGELNAIAEGRLKRFTITAFALRLVLAFLPDLTALSLNDALAFDADFTYLRFKPLFIGFSVIVSLAINIVWLIQFIKFTKKVITKDIIQKCNINFFEKAENKKSLFVAKDNMRAIIFSIIGAISIVDISWGYNNVDIFQDFIFPLFAALAFTYLLVKGVCSFDKSFIFLIASLVLYIGASVFEINANISYYEKYSVTSMLRVSEAEDMYFVLCVSAILSSIMLIVSSVAVFLVMRSNAKRCIIEHSDLFSHSDINYYLKEFGIRTRKQFIIMVSLSVVCAIAYSLMVILKPFAEWMILVNTICEACLVISVIGFYMYIYDEVYKRILTFS